MLADTALVQNQGLTQIRASTRNRCKQCKKLDETYPSHIIERRSIF